MWQSADVTQLPFRDRDLSRELTNCSLSFRSGQTLVVRRSSTQVCTHSDPTSALPQKRPLSPKPMPPKKAKNKSASALIDRSCAPLLKKIRDKDPNVVKNKPGKPGTIGGIPNIHDDSDGAFTTEILAGCVKLYSLHPSQTPNSQSTLPFPKFKKDLIPLVQRFIEAQHKAGKYKDPTIHHQDVLISKINKFVQQDSKDSALLAAQFRQEEDTPQAEFQDLGIPQDFTDTSGQPMTLVIDNKSTLSSGKYPHPMLLLTRSQLSGESFSAVLPPY
jgi:hypothetical protein